MILKARMAFYWSAKEVFIQIQTQKTPACTNGREHQMSRRHSISFRLSVVICSFFVLIIVLGLFSIGRLSDFNGVSTDLSGIWLPSIRFLGDLNNYTSDYRAAEATSILSPNSTELSATEKDIAELDRTISLAEQNYEKTPHDTTERNLYIDFKQKWINYRQIADRVLVLVRAGQRAEANTIYLATSKLAYNAASDTLGELTDRSVAGAHAATNRVTEAYGEARWLISVAMLSAGVMIAAALLYLRRSISRPLLSLAAAMHRLAVNDTNTDVKGVRRPDEIGEMARAAVVFRANAIELTLSQAGLAREASVLAEKLEHEQRLTQLQRNFVSVVSHEFRTPLNIIDGHAQRLIKMKQQLSPDQIVERAGKIRSAVIRMTNLIDNFLDSSRLMDSDAGFFHPVQVDIRLLLHEVCQLHREIAPGSEIRENLDPLSGKMNGDPKLLFQMFSNLLSNAIKYSPAGSPISVNAVVDGESLLVIEIQDHGIGIPESDINKLFERYSRGSNVSGIIGSGIGLYIVKMVVELHSGAIFIESKEGRGSRITVRLPFGIALTKKNNPGEAYSEALSAVRNLNEENDNDQILPANN